MQSCAIAVVVSTFALSGCGGGFLERGVEDSLSSEGVEVDRRAQGSACDGNPCLNGGTCSGTDLFFICKCPASGMGPRCEGVGGEIRVDACANNPCLNGGTCGNLDGSSGRFFCECPVGWSGSTCESARPASCESCDFGYSVGCNTCQCVNGRATCTEMGCLAEEPLCLPPPTHMGATFVGCYKEGPWSAFGTFLPLARDSQSFTTCMNLCVELGASFMALRDAKVSDICSCGDTFTTGGEFEQVAADECNSGADHCAVEFGCGAVSRNAVWATTAARMVAHMDSIFMGCYKDTANTAFVGESISVGHGHTFSRCQNHCVNQGARFMGIQGGYKCYCGDAFQTQSPVEKVPDHECKRPCEVEFGCGGASHSSVWVTIGVPLTKHMGATFMGCYRDNHERAFAGDFVNLGRNSQTFNNCLKHCTSQGVRFMALQYGQECFCGDTFPTRMPFVQMPDDECNVNADKCGVEFGCGGVWRNSVWNIEDIDNVNGDERRRLSELLPRPFQI